MELFSQETELVNAFTSKSNEFLRSLFRKRTAPMFLIHEFNSYHGVADIVLGTLKENRALDSRRETINPNWVTPLAKLKKGEIVNVHEFSKLNGLSVSTARKYLNDYVRAGFVKKTQVATFTVTREYQSILDLVVSVEAKLRDWKRALVQAQRYKRFSDFSFVLLDGTQSEAAIKNLDVFRDKDIGLISMIDDKFTVHHLPNRNEKKLPEYALRINEMAYDNYSTQSC